MFKKIVVLAVAILIIGFSVGLSKGFNMGALIDSHTHVNSLSDNQTGHKHHDAENNTILEKQRNERSKGKKFDSSSIVYGGHSMFYYDHEGKNKLVIHFSIMNGENDMRKEGEGLVFKVLSSIRKVMVRDRWAEINPLDDPKYLPKSVQSIDVFQEEANVGIEILKDNGDMVHTYVDKHDTPDRVAIEVYGILFGVVA